jgi:hypothetical protein
MEGPPGAGLGGLSSYPLQEGVMIMKRDMELVRKIILKLEDQPTGFTKDFSIDGYSEEQIRYHNSILLEAGWVRGFDVTNLSSSGPEGIATGINVERT